MGKGCMYEVGFRVTKFIVVQEWHKAKKISFINLYIHTKTKKTRRVAKKRLEINSR